MKTLHQSDGLPTMTGKTMGNEAKKSWMKPEDLTKAREKLGLTKAELGSALDITYRQIHNFEEGKSPVPKWLMLIIKLAVAGTVQLKPK
jgi:DNA-binding XRE family transcriptional regulator